MAYLYRHIRNDKNQVFYVGIGTDAHFFRAKDLKRRNKHWNNITTTTDWYSEIIFIHDDHNIIKLKEIEFIKLYGRKCDGGILCNITLGGEGTLGVKPKNIKKCFGLDSHGNIHNFNSITDAAKHLGDERLTSSITNICKGKTHICKGWRFGYTKEDLTKPFINMTGKIKVKTNSRSVTIYGRSPNGLIVEFTNPYHAAKVINGHHTLIRKVAKGLSTHTKGWCFSYDKTKL